MADVKKEPSLMPVLTVCVVFIALISFFLPLYSVNFFITYSYSGFDAVMDAVDNPQFPELGVALCLICSIIGVICSLVAIKWSNAGVGVIITSAIGMILMIVSMTDDSDMLKAIDYAAVGFYLYEIMCFSAIILSAASMHMSKGAVPWRENPIFVTKPQPEPALKPGPSSKKICPKCKKEQDKDASFCRFCGTPLGESTAAPPAPKPDPRPTPKPAPKGDPIKNRKVICPHCGARHIEGTTKCKYCGTLFDGNESVSPKPGPVPHPNPAATPAPNPAPLKKDGKVICPHCGARQKEDTAKCKYCGTPIH